MLTTGPSSVPSEKTLDKAGQGDLPLTANVSSRSLLYSLVGWVEGAARTNNSPAMMTAVGGAPESVIGTKFVNDTAALGIGFTRPICRWPQTAVYDGVGDVNDAASWGCPTAGIY